MRYLVILLFVGYFMVLLSHKVRRKAEVIYRACKLHILDKEDDLSNDGSYVSIQLF